MSLAGSSHSLPLPDLIQATAYTGRTCCVVIDPDGELGFDHGELVAARHGALRGDAAVLALLAMAHVTYRMDPAAPLQHDVTASWQHLVMESARLKDEATRRMRRQSLGTVSGPVASSFSGPLPLPAPAAPPPTLAEPVRAPRRWLVAVGAAVVTAAIVVGGTVAMKAIRREPAATGAVAVAAPAATLPATAGAARAPAATAAPTAIDAPLPAPPPGARSGLAPTIVVRMRVEPDGSVGEAHVYRPRPELAAWEDAALAAARRWRFTAPHHGGVAAAVWINAPISFATRAAPARTLVVKGSDTIGGEHGAGPALAAAYEAAHPDTRVVWEGLGSSTAFVGLLDGSADVGASSRPVKAGELEEAERLGVRLTEYVLGYDGIAVIVHPSAPIAALSVPQLRRVFTGEIRTWRELAPDAPDAPIRLLARPSYSGTQAFFKDKILDGAELSARTEVVEQSEAIAAAVAADPHAISFIGMAWVTGSVRALAVAPTDGAAAVAPGLDTIRAGTYPIYRPLLLYVRGLPTPAIAELLRYCLGGEGQAVVAARGFVPGDTPIEAVIAGDDTAAAAPTVALRVPFAAGQAVLDADARVALTALAAELRAAPRAVTLHGHADAERGASSNSGLARQRAEAVAAFLRTRGVDGRRITVESAGDAAPVATNTTRAGRGQNRRVDVVLAAP